MAQTNVIIMGAAGRDFHNFNLFYRTNPSYRVVAFTAAQIPDIDDRRYPPELAGEHYPDGIPIVPETQLEQLIREHAVEEVTFAYSDVSNEHVMHVAARVNNTGADFRLLGSGHTMLTSQKPVVAVCAVRTGCGKSQTTRRVAELFTEAGKQVVVIRHPMPYGDLAAQKVQRFAALADLQTQHCTIEEMEEYEPHINRGSVVYAGVDYQAILEQAETEADIILWDGGNNDMPFIRPDLMITVTDPHRPGHEIAYYPGEANLRMADAVIINKIDTADADNVRTVRKNIAAYNPDATVIDAASPLTVEDPKIFRGKRVLVVEDGPTVTHGGMRYGAGVMAARKFGAAELVDPRPFTAGSISETFRTYPEIGNLLPAMGYGEQQMKDLEATITKTDCDLVVIGTPIDLRRIITIDHPSVRVTYDLQEIGKPDLTDVLTPLLRDQ